MAHSFNAQQEDTLTELINVSFGLSASLIGDLLESYAKLHIPEISNISILNLDDKIIEVLENKNEFYLTRQRFLGSFNGEVLFVFDDQSANVFTALLLQQEECDENDVKPSILELTNIITSACIGKFCEMIDGETIFQVPSIEKREIENMEQYDQIEGYENVIVIKTALDIEKENILGHMFILLNDEMLENLKIMMDNL